MAWGEITILETPGIDPTDVPGFVQSVDFDAATAWFEAARIRTTPAVEAAANAGGYAAQLTATRRAWEALSNAYRACNLAWFSDPAAADAWHAFWGNYAPIDPSPICTSATPGPFAIATGAPWAPRMPTDVAAEPALRAAWKREHPPVAPEVLGRLRDIWVSLKGPLPTRRVEVYNAERTAYANEAERARELGYPVPPPPSDLPAPVYQTVEVFEPVVIAPAFLDYRSVARVLDTKNTASGTAGQRFDGVFVGTGCVIPVFEPISPLPPPPTDLLIERPLGAVPSGHVEVPRDTSVWSWDCVRWDDAPGQTLRMLPPLRWAFEFARTLAGLLKARGVKRVVMDARIHQILTNIERAKEFAEGELEGFDTILYETLKENRTLRFDATRDRQMLKAVGTQVCGIAALAGGGPGLLCAGAAAAADVVLGLLPRAVGCELPDEWGQTMPSALRAQISMDVPPAFTVPMPDDVAINVNLPWSPPGAVDPNTLPLRLDIRVVGPIVPPPTTPDEKDPGQAPPASPPPTAPPPVVAEEMSPVAVAATALGFGWGLVELLKRMR